VSLAFAVPVVATVDVVDASVLSEPLELPPPHPATSTAHAASRTPTPMMEARDIVGTLHHPRARVRLARGDLNRTP
jgi:hypothetical protein